ncbi:MAG: S8 family serine peptidase [Thermoleophilia bacterium]|nr:S8 family serine peptidase [Thermoleophilia bacterium]
MRRRRVALGAAGGVAALAVAVAAVGQGDGTTPTGPVPEERPGDAARVEGLAAAAAWADSIGAVRSPRLPDPGDTEHLVVLLDGPGAAWRTPAQRAAAAADISRRQAELEPAIAALGGVVTARWRVTVAGMAVEVPAGRADAVAALPGVRGVAPAGYLAPAARGTGPAGPSAGEDAEDLPGGVRPAHIALIDTALDPRTPQLGGGIGPTYPVIGGADLVDGDADPTVGDGAANWEAHGTQMAGLVLRSPALAGLPPQRVPRLLAYRVVSAERVGGQELPLARTDRVVSAIERAVDPDGDGDPADRADVLLIGLAGGFAGGGEDPVALASDGATRAGALVVAPAGNDGPTYARLGSVGQPAAGSRVLTVGGLAGADAPRQARLHVDVGPAGADLAPLPLLGPDPVSGPVRVVSLPGQGGPGPGTDAAEYAAAAASGVDVRGALVIVSRGGGTCQETAQAAAAAGAAAVLVWDRAGVGVFPSGASDGGPVIPVLGAGRDQGQALSDLVAGQAVTTGGIAVLPREAAPATVASFSSTGPTADGRVKPELVAPAVEVPTAWPPGPGGEPRSATMTGTSAAAAPAAALALRTRIDRPELTPEEVRALLVASGDPLPDVRMVAQGAGRLTTPGTPAAVLRPPILTAASRPGTPRVDAVVTDLAGTGGTYRLVVLSAAGRPVTLGPRVVVPAGGRASVTVTLPVRRRGWSGRVAVVEDATSRVVSVSPAATFPPRRVQTQELGVPHVTLGDGVAQVAVRIGRLARDGDRILSSPLRDVRLEFVPVDGSEPLVAAGLGGSQDWPAGTYQFVLSRRLPTGGTVPQGRYRLRVEARTAEGRQVSSESAVFALR